MFKFRLSLLDHLTYQKSVHVCTQVSLSNLCNVKIPWVWKLLVGNPSLFHQLHVPMTTMLVAWGCATWLLSVHTCSSIDLSFSRRHWSKNQKQKMVTYIPQYHGCQKLKKRCIDNVRDEVWMTFDGEYSSCFSFWHILFTHYYDFHL